MQETNLMPLPGIESRFLDFQARQHFATPAAPRLISYVLRYCGLLEGNNQTLVVE